MSYKVLIVDDDPMVAMINEQYVNKNPSFSVAGSCRNGNEALEFLTSNKSSNKIDLVVLDVFMPYMDGVIQHTGICTLQEERRKGYGKCTAALAVHNLIRHGICPQWECDGDNIASLSTAKAVGFREYGTAYIVKER